MASSALERCTQAVSHGRDSAPVVQEQLAKKPQFIEVNMRVLERALRSGSASSQKSGAGA